ncbi:uncharacterized protein NPIL_489401 [Nephila pilipes]|uniref:DNA-directed DNA polymerase n=1 Tax=Nephila pilipes TaxID=299642 RepID=A0A8X6PMZ0_NEPPI|nr:uncharacterized protein NPIL_489401 [Nephila pilipes]
MGKQVLPVFRRTPRRRRQVAKLALNSFWGRWGMNLNKTKLSYVNSVPDFNRYLSDPTKNIKDIFLPRKRWLQLNGKCQTNLWNRMPPLTFL